MEIPVVFLSRPGSKEGLIRIKALNNEKVTVLQVYSSSNHQVYALKLFPRNFYGITHYKREKILFKLNHPNIIKCTPLICCDEEYFAIATEFAKHGDFFDIVTKGYLNSDLLIRTYFHQLIAGLEYIHSKGVAHLDLKLENIMLGADYQLKIIDFDQSQVLTDKIVQSGGTVSYRSPEILKGKCTHFTAADVFSAGVVLFAFKAKEFPFVEKIIDPECQDHRSYLTFMKNNKHFWKMKALGKKNNSFFSEEFIHLLNGMMHENPLKRLTIKEIKESKWYKGPVLDKLGMIFEMKYKCEINTIKKRPVFKKLQIDTKLPLIYDPGRRIDTC